MTKNKIVENIRKIEACLIACVATLMTTMSAVAQDVVIENRDMRLVLGEDGCAKSLIHKPTGEECLCVDAGVPFSAIVQYRPYDNENFLMFPAKPRIFPSNKIRRVGDELHIEYKDTYDITIVKLNITPDYIGFCPVRMDYRLEDYGVKRKTEVDELAMIQLPVKPREHFGEWLNVAWDDNVAVNVMGTDPETRIDAYSSDRFLKMYAGTDFSVKLLGAGAALIVSSRDELLDRIDRVEQDYGLPRGVESRRCPEYRYSYYELRDENVDNIDEHLEYARRAGLKTVVVYYKDIMKSCGHFLWNDSFPNGLEDLKRITDKIREADMIPGFHIHYSKVSVNDPYINSGKPDARMNTVRNFILAEDLKSGDDQITVAGRITGVRVEPGRRLLMIDNELISYEDFTTEPPYRFTGCKRGVYDTRPADHAQGGTLRLLDVDDWPIFIRVDQNTDIQEEIAERLAHIYREVGFRFVYFDGAEDVPYPYWYNVSRSQNVVYNALDPKPIFSEGALKSHYGWHILTRGNAFDIFPPERIRTAMKRYTLRCARRIADDFTSVNFGWANYLAPSEHSIGMQADMFDYICSKALAWDAPISLIANLPDLRKHPRTDDILRTVALWEQAKIENRFSDREKQLLKDPDREFTLLECKNRKGVELYEWHQLTSDTERPIRAFGFERNGKNCIVYWNTDGVCDFEVEIDSRKLRLEDDRGKRIAVRKNGKKVILTAADRRIIESDLSAGELEAKFLEGVAAIQKEVIKK